MTTQPAQQQSPPNPDTQSENQARANNRTLILVAVIGTLGLIVVALIGVIQEWWGPSDSPSTDPVSIEIANEDEFSPTVSGPVTLKGKVENLGPGQTVWSFDLPAGSSGAWAHDGPCPVDEKGNWTCPVFDLGDLDGADNGKDFKIFAAVLDDSDIPQQIDMRLDRYKDIYNPMKSPVPPAVAMDSVNTTKK